MRLFVALELPGPAALALAEFRDAAANSEIWRPLPDEALHATLVFLGELPDDDLERVAEAISGAVEPGAPRLRIGGALLLPPRGARVLCAGLADVDGRLGEVQRALAGALAAAGLHTPEKRRFRPHVTVARLRKGSRAPRSADGLPAPEPVGFEGERIALFKSVMRPGGAEYEPLVWFGF